MVVSSSSAGQGAPIPAALALLLAASLFAPVSATPTGGFRFDGSKAYVVPANALSIPANAFALAAWVWVDSTETSQVFMNRGAANSHFTFYLYEGKVRMLVAPRKAAGGGAATADLGYVTATGPALAAGAWVHLAGSYDGANIRLYYDGKEVASAAAPGQLEDGQPDLYIGSLDRESRFLTGRMNDVRIWNRAVSPTEIADIVAGNSSNSIAKGLVGHWNTTMDSQDLPAHLPSRPPLAVGAVRFDKEVLIQNRKADGYRGIWYFIGRSNDEYVYKYSGGLGTYCANHIPMAWYAPAVDKTFFVYGGTTPDANNRLLHMVSYYDHKTGMVPKPTILLDKKTDDAHDNPVINLDEKGHLWIFSSSHGTGRPSYISRSAKPYDIDSFELVWTGNFSYPQPWYFPGKGFLFIHVFYGVGGRSIQMMRSPDGVNWGERRLLSYIDEGHYEVSRPFGNKIGIAFNYHPKGLGLDYRTNLYYMESDDFGETWKTASGEVLTVPLRDIINPALVKEYEHADPRLNVYTQDLTHDSAGNPVVLYTTSLGFQSGPKNDPRTWVTARWTGSTWDIQGSIRSDNNYDTGSIYVESDDLWRLIGPTEQGPQAYNPGGEIAMWVSRDKGHTWNKKRQMTQNSPYNHTYVRRPVDAQPAFYGFWADGHGRKPSDSRIYFCNRDGDVFRLPAKMNDDMAKPELVK